MWLSGCVAVELADVFAETHGVKQMELAPTWGMETDGLPRWPVLLRRLS